MTVSIKQPLSEARLLPPRGLLPPTKRRSGRAATTSQILDHLRLRTSIAAIHARELKPEDRRREVLALFRDALNTGREQAKAALDANKGGLACATFLSQLQDELIGAIHHYIVTHVLSEAHVKTEPFAVVAVGGYGRATLAPASDVDILFLLPAEAGPGEKIAEAILYILWDLRQKIGHSTRSVEECLSQARQDMTVRTAVLEARFICGDRALFEDMRERFDREIVRGTPSEFVAAKLAERDSRIARAGRSRYLVEPNVKEGKGGLRDLNTLFWIAKYVYRLRDASELVEAGLFSRSEYRLFCRCEEFLWRVRCHLHFLTGRAEERLSFDFQRVIADRLGYAARAGLVGVERFMKHYFLIAKDVGDLTAIVCAALEERQAKPRAMLDRSVGGMRPRSKIVMTRDFAIENDRVTIAAPDVFMRDPVNFIRLFWLADQNGLAIHPDATRLVTQSLKRIGGDLRNDADANRLFLEILTSRNAPEIVLRLMNQAGMLGRFIPEFGRIVALMQFNMYHHYTVDEHLLQAVGHLTELERYHRPEDARLVGEILPTIRNRTALYLALFLHDIAKGRAEDHSVAGVQVARKLGPRLGLPPAQVDTVAWLIENHLVMSDTAQRRDLGDRRTIETFAARVRTLERLKLLLILTICDIRAVGPGVWNGWKGDLLRTLYAETEVVLSGGHSLAARKRRVELARAELRRALPAWPDLVFDAYAARHQGDYWLKVDVAHKVRHAQLLNMSEVEMPEPLTDIATDPARGVTELTVIAPDHPRLLSIIAGACAAAGANIVDAQAFTTTDGMALDTIYVSRAFDFDEDEVRRAERITLAIERALRGEIRFDDMIAAKDGLDTRKKAFDVPGEVSIDNRLSNRFSVIEVSGLDRPGLLYNLTRVLWKLELNIGSAHIATFGEKAADVFYVTDFQGAKITSTSRKALIRHQILTSFEGRSVPIAV